MDTKTFLENFGTIAEFSSGVAQLRDLVLELAISGRLIDHSDPIRFGPFTSADCHQVPATWSTSTAGSLGEFVRGVTYAKSDSSLDPGNGRIGLLRANNISGSLNYANLVFVDEMKVKDEQVLRVGDFLICTSSGSNHLVGKAAVVEVDSPRTCFGAFCSTFRPNDLEMVPYLSLYFQSPVYRLGIASSSRGIGINNLRTSDLKSLEIPIPPLAEQKRIVAKVDELMALCDELEEKQQRKATVTTKLRGSAFNALRQAETPDDLAAAWERISTNWSHLSNHPDSIPELREVVLELGTAGRLVSQDSGDEPAKASVDRARALGEKSRPRGGSREVDSGVPEIADEDLPPGWVNVPLGLVVEIVRGITFPSSAKENGPGPGRVACLRTSNVQQDLEWGDLLYVAEDFVRSDEQYLRPGDLMISMANSRALVGKVALNRRTDMRATFGGFIAALRPFEMLPEFLMAALRVPSARERLIDSATQTTNIANISLGRLRPFVISLPPLAEQKRIVTRIAELMSMCDELEKQLQHQQDLNSRLAIASTRLAG